VERIEIVDATADQLERARALILEYAESRGFPLTWQGFDEEVATLPGHYAQPNGRLCVATLDGEPVGCVALRPFDETRCEMKRLYVRPSARGRGLGRLLAEHVIAEAREIGYDEMLLDTLDRMEEAAALYRSIGFAATEPYRFNPLPDVQYLHLDLREVR
jgi:putative acetyltransferase